MADDADPVLAFEGVRRVFGSNAGVKGIDLAVRRGEIMTLLGPSGCGKTTTLRMASGLERASEGRITYLGQPVDDPAARRFVPPERRGIGMVFQSYAIWPHMSVYENVAFPLDLRRVPEAEKRAAVARTLDLVGLAGFEDRPGTQLSGGQQQRVAVARGLIASRDLLLMDEPFSNLDAGLRSQLRVELKRLQRDLGFAILFVTHDQEEALALSDRIAVIREGQVEQVGAPDALYRQPATPMVRDFLGRTLTFPTRIERVEADGRVIVSFADGRIFEVTGPIHCRDLTPGARTMVTTRPECVTVVPGAEQENAPNTLSARIRTLLFMGEAYEADVELPGNHMSLLRLSSGLNWQEAMPVRLRFSAAELQLWDRETGAAYAL